MSTVSIRKVLDGRTKAIFYVYFKADGLGELVDQVLIDPQVDLEPKANRIRVEEITYNFAGFDAAIEFDSGLVDDTPIWVLPQGTESHVCFNQIGGFSDVSGLDGTGKLLLTTPGFDAATKQGSMVITVRKV